MIAAKRRFFYELRPQPLAIQAALGFPRYANALDAFRLLQPSRPLEVIATLCCERLRYPSEAISFWFPKYCVDLDLVHIETRIMKS
jgi:hypothetical protein